MLLYRVEKKSCLREVLGKASWSWWFTCRNFKKISSGELEEKADGKEIKVWSHRSVKYTHVSVSTWYYYDDPGEVGEEDWSQRKGSKAVVKRKE